MTHTHNELWLKYRPKTFDEIVGQTTVVKLLKNFIKNNKVPHTILFSGPSGVGKTTLAHIMTAEMGCGSIDKNVINCATVPEPLEAIRSLEQQIKLSPTSNSKCRVFILEELQSLFRSKSAREALLLMLESATRSTKDSYVMCCTTNPEKLDKTILNRCKKIELTTLSNSHIKSLLTSISSKENRVLPDPVLDHIIDISRGCAREAINQLDTALAAGEDVESMMSALSGVKKSDMADKLVQALFWKKTTWENVVAIIEEIKEDSEGSDLESFRYRVLFTAASEIKKGGTTAHKAYHIYEIFQMDSWEVLKIAGLISACWQVMRDRKC